MFCSIVTMRMTVLSVLFLLMKTGFGMTATCRPICTGDNCVTVNRDRVDFKTAEETCRDMNGELMTFQLEADESTLGPLSQELFGNFWIGLHLPAGTCSNLSAPLRGYKWTSGSTHRISFPSSTTWKDSVKVCSPHCVSLSNNRKWTERLCTDKTEGFLCRTKHKDACKAQGLSDLDVFQSSKGCSDSPCEHKCTDVKGGYKCSCFKGYIPDKKDPKRCKIHCGQSKCPMICERNADTCFCPDGFVRNEKFCEDINECLMDQCDQECKNTHGSFVCSCREGHVLKDQVKCIKAEDSESFVVITPVAVDFIKPAINNNTLKVSSAPKGSFLWIWIFVAVAVVVLIFVVRFYVVKRQRLREQSSNQQSTSAASGNNIEC